MAQTKQNRRRAAARWIAPVAIVAAAAPGAYVALQWALAAAGQPNELGFNSAEWTHHFLGQSALRFLLASLVVTPVVAMTRLTPLLRARRVLGLAAFAYGVVHLLVYLGLDLMWSMPALAKEIQKRVYITAGIAALTLMVPLALTSTNGMIRRLGAQAWKRLHRLAYPAAVLAVMHHLFVVKGLQPEPLIHAGILAALLLWRVWTWAAPKQALVVR
jgi:sulfoxide reductase heme-binding subunit YedZ